MNYWTKCVPLAWGIGMTDSDSPLFGANRCEIRAQDAGNGVYLSLEFKAEELKVATENPHMGFFNTHEEIDIFASHLHACLDAASVAND